LGYSERVPDATGKEVRVELAFHAISRGGIGRQEQQVGNPKRTCLEPISQTMQKKRRRIGQAQKMIGGGRYWTIFRPKHAKKPKPQPPSLPQLQQRVPAENIDATINYRQNAMASMNKRVILVTGTPAVGKTTLAVKLAQKLGAQYVNLTELAEKEHLAAERDPERDTAVIDEAKMRRRLRKLINQAQTDLVIDGHYAAAVTPKPAVTNVFVLRRNPQELREFMKKRGYSQPKQDENLAAEILDVCLIEALQKQEKSRICELDVTGKTPTAALSEVLNVLASKKPCRAGAVDWMDLLERAGKLDDFLKT
jgi:adenylate kinase